MHQNNHNKNILENLDIEQIHKLMEEMAYAPRESLEKRQPGERNMYELHNEQLSNSRMPRQAH